MGLWGKIKDKVRGKETVSYDEDGYKTKTSRSGGVVSKARKAVSDKIDEEKELYRIRRDTEKEERKKDAENSVRDKYSERRKARRKEYSNRGSGGIGGLPDFVFGSQAPASAPKKKGRGSRTVNPSSPRGGEDSIWGGMGGDIDNLIHGSSPSAPRSSRRSQGSPGGGYSGGLGFFDADPESYLHGKRRD